MTWPSVSRPLATHVAAFGVAGRTSARPPSGERRTSSASSWKSGESTAETARSVTGRDSFRSASKSAYRIGSVKTGKPGDASRSGPSV